MLPGVAEKALGVRRGMTYLVTMTISDHLQFSFLARVTKETKFLMLHLKLYVLYLETGALLGIRMRGRQRAGRKEAGSKGKSSGVSSATGVRLLGDALGQATLFLAW